MSTKLPHKMNFAGSGTVEEARHKEIKDLRAHMEALNNGLHDREMEKERLSKELEECKAQWKEYLYWLVLFPYMSL